MQPENTDDRLTLMALGILAFILADVTHEILGHGLTALALGAKLVLLTTCYINTDGYYSRWIPAAGGLANVCMGLLSLVLLRAVRPRSPRLHYFLVLAAGFNLFFAAGYPAYSGIALFGDWAAVISGDSPAWVWRTLLVLISVTAYFLSMLLVAHAIRPFCGSRDPRALQRLRRITLIPYLAAMIAACLGGIPNPAGWTVMFTSALPAAAASFGFTQLDNFSAATSPNPHIESRIESAGMIARSSAWIAAAAVVLVFFVALGRGIRFS